MADVSKVVLITGCSTGIGRATASGLDRGYTVYAGLQRRPESIADLGQRGCRTLALDVTDEASMTAAVAEVEGAEGAVGALVNNAGYSQSGRSRACRSTASAPSSRRTSSASCACVSSCCRGCAASVRPDRERQLDGRQADLPGGGVYHATKHAVEALSDAMRFEVKALARDVSIIEPGLIKTVRRGGRRLDRLRRRAVRQVQQSRGGVHRGRLRGTAREARRRSEAVAKAIERAISSGRPRTRYPVTLLRCPGAAGAASRPRLTPWSVPSTPRRSRECRQTARSDQLAYFTDEAEVYVHRQAVPGPRRRGAWPEVPQGEHDRPVPLPRTPIADYGRADGGRQGRVEAGSYRHGARGRDDDGRRHRHTASGSGTSTSRSPSPAVRSRPGDRSRRSSSSCRWSSRCSRATARCSRSRGARTSWRLPDGGDAGGRHGLPDGGLQGLLPPASTTRVIAGREPLASTGFELQKEGARRVFLVTDAGVSETGLVEREERAGRRRPRGRGRVQRRPGLVDDRGRLRRRHARPGRTRSLAVGGDR